ncbi:hypothetical protein LCGC14_2785530 [marine sediment metagenome]|uniref:Uncharacterized protein n=1 Tax=marine sediment metagenome TaxID=412755 RepID=A0A0F9BIH7_9ZZZZ
MGGGRCQVLEDCRKDLECYVRSLGNVSTSPGALAGWGVSGILLGDHLSSAFFFLFIGVLSVAVSSWRVEEAWRSIAEAKQQVRKYEGMAKGTHWM